jgi:dipeptidase E
MSNVLMLSNSTMPGTDFFTWPRPAVQQFLGNKKVRLLFIPFAAVTFSFDDYALKVKTVFSSMGFDLESIHEFDDKLSKIREADGIVVGGGNTFALLHRMYEHGLVESVRNKILSGSPYIGWSAGANLAGPTIMTTNDMPVVQPQSFKALNLVPFQINPHYHELKFEGQGGETRKERLEEFLVMNPDLKVVGLPEGMFLQRKGDRLFLQGTGIAKYYAAGSALSELKAGSDLSYLLK